MESEQVHTDPIALVSPQTLSFTLSPFCFESSQGAVSPALLLDLTLQVVQV